MSMPAEHRDLTAELTLGESGRVWEGLVTTRNADGSTNVAPMGPIAGPAFDFLLLRPYAASRTCANLERMPRGVFQLTDDVEALAAAVVKPADWAPKLVPIEQFDVPRLADCCRWYAFELVWFDVAPERTTALARVVDHGAVRDCCGFNRAKHAVLEAAILATRVGILPTDEIVAEFDRLAVIVRKTGAAAELQAFAVLERFVAAAGGALTETAP